MNLQIQVSKLPKKNADYEPKDTSPTTDKIYKELVKHPLQTNFIVIWRLLYSIKIHIKVLTLLNSGLSPRAINLNAIIDVTKISGMYAPMAFPTDPWFIVSSQFWWCHPKITPRCLSIMLALQPYKVVCRHIQSSSPNKIVFNFFLNFSLCNQLEEAKFRKICLPPSLLTISFLCSDESVPRLENMQNVQIFCGIHLCLRYSCLFLSHSSL